MFDCFHYFFGSSQILKKLSLDFLKVFHFKVASTLAVFIIFKSVERGERPQLSLKNGSPPFGKAT